MMDMNDAIKELRSQKDKTGTPGHYLYKMLETAHPNVVSYIEHQAASAMIMARGIRSTIEEKQKTEEGRKELEKHLSRLASRMNKTSFTRNQEEKERKEKERKEKERKEKEDKKEE